MTVMRVERVVYGVPNLEECVRFFTDFGLDPLDGGPSGARFATRRARCSSCGTPMTEPAAAGPGRADAARDRLGRGQPGVAGQAGDEPAVGPVGLRRRGPGGDPTDETGFGVGLAVSQPVTGRTNFPGSNRLGT